MGQFLNHTLSVPSTVQLVRVPDDGVPRAGVTSVGEFANTRAHDPVSSVTALARLALDGVARNVATPVHSPLTPVEIGSPVRFVAVPDEGVPRAPPFTTGAHTDPTFVARAVAIHVHGVIHAHVVRSAS
jgi:hypothetical protein